MRVRANQGRSRIDERGAINMFERFTDRARRVSYWHKKRRAC